MAGQLKIAGSPDLLKIAGARAEHKGDYTKGSYTAKLNETTVRIGQISEATDTGALNPLEGLGSN